MDPAELSLLAVNFSVEIGGKAAGVNGRRLFAETAGQAFQPVAIMIPGLPAMRIAQRLIGETGDERMASPKRPGQDDQQRHPGGRSTTSAALVPKASSAFRIA